MKGLATGITIIIIILVIVAYLFYAKPEFDFGNIIDKIKGVIPAGVNQTPVPFFSSSPKQEIVVDETSYPLLFENPRWAKMPIRYYLDAESGEGIQNFGPEDLSDVRIAFDIWNEKTGGTIILVETGNRAEADVFVSWFPSIREVKGGKVVGEGGPSKAVNTGLFTLISEGEIFLVPDERSCINVNRAVHEFGHVLGLDHTHDENDVMFSREVNCEQELTQTTINVVKNLYEIPASPDMIFLNASGTKRGVLMDMTFSVKNQGLLNSPATVVDLFADGKRIESFDLPSMKPGETITTKLTNVRVPAEFSTMSLVVDPSNIISEIFEDNNAITLVPG